MGSHHPTEVPVGNNSKEWLPIGKTPSPYYLFVDNLLPRQHSPQCDSVVFPGHERQP